MQDQLDTPVLTLDLDSEHPPGTAPVLRIADFEDEIAFTKPLLAKGLDRMLCRVSSKVGKVAIYAEYDLWFLLEASYEVEAMAAQRQAEVWIRLNDGVLEVHMTAIAGRVRCEVHHIPGLNKLKREDDAFDVSIDQCLSAWRDVARQIERLCGPGIVFKSSP